MLSHFLTVTEQSLKASLVAQTLKRLPSMQGTWVQSLVQEDPTGCKVTKPLCQNY